MPKAVNKSQIFKKKALVIATPDDFTERERYLYIAKKRFSLTSCNASFKDRLVECGLKKTFIKKYYHLIQPLEHTCYSYQQLFDIIIEYSLNEYQELTLPKSHFYIEPTITNTWFQYNNLQIFNMTQTTNINFTHNLPIPNYTLYFHTTSWRSFNTIQQIGIKLSKNRPCLDFGILPSFYLTPDFATSEEWAFKRSRIWKNESCILVFQICNKMLKQYNSKIFNSVTKEWKNLVKSSRQCQEEYNQLDTFDFVYGPMVANAEDAAAGKDPKSHKPPKYQLAVKQDRLSNIILDSLYGVIFLDKQRKKN